MAFDIERTGRSLPSRGPGVITDLDVRTGRGQVARAFGQAGAEVQETASILHRLQADNQFAEARRKVQETLNALADEYQRNPDSTTYQQRFNEAMGEMKQFTPKNPLAARSFSQLLEDTRVSGDKMVQASALARERDLKRANVEEARARRDFASARRGVAVGFQNGAYSKEEATKKFIEINEDEKQAVHDAELEAVLIKAFNDPETTLKDLKDGNLEGTETLTTNDLLRVRNIAIIRLSDERVKDNDQISAGRRTVNDSAWNSVLQNDLESAQKAYMGTPEKFGTDWKNAELNKLAKASKLMTEKRINPYTKRMDNKAYQTALQKAIDGTLSFTDADEGVGDKWTVEDGRTLREIIAGDTNKAQDQEDLQAFRDMNSIISGADTFVAQPGAKNNAIIKARGLLEDEIKAAKATGNPLRGTDLQIVYMRIARDMVRQVESGLTPEKILPIPEKLPPPGSPVESGGEIIGTVDTDGKLLLNRNGLRRLKTITGGDKARAREIIKERGWKIGK